MKDPKMHTKICNRLYKVPISRKALKMHNKTSSKIPSNVQVLKKGVTFLIVLKGLKN